MKKNSTNSDKANIFERIKAFFSRRKNADKEVLDDVVLKNVANDVSEISTQTSMLDSSFDSSDVMHDSLASDSNDNADTQSNALSENVESKEIVEERVLSDESESQGDSKLTAQQEYVACKNINVTVPETLVRSFVAKLVGIDSELQEYYSHLKNYALSFSGTRYRTSWQYDSIYKTKVLIARFVIKGKSLWMYVRLSPEEIPEGTNFVTTNDKKYEGLECGLKIQGARTFKQAKTLLLKACEKEGLVFSEREEENFIPAPMSDEELLDQGLIRKVIFSTNPK